MSLALYRKYRPATFAELKGQEHVAEPLQQALRNGRINHAYLFSGPRGCGKTSSARILARSLNCEQGPTPDPCGKCDSCVALGPGGTGHIDVIEIDAASHGGVDDARDLRERAFFAPVSARFKVYIIDEAHMVTREGFNALLKLVEEPPPHLKFVFATTEPEKVIGTIRSRTHHYPFRLIPPGVLQELVEEILQAEDVPYEPSALPLAVRAGAGSARDTLSILDQLLAGSDEKGITYARAVLLLGYTDSALLGEVIAAFAARDGAAVFAAIDRVVESGQDPRRFTADLLERVRDLVILSNIPEAGGSGLLNVPPDELEQMRRQASSLGPGELSRAADLLHTGLTEMRGATSPRLLLELICARILLPAAYEDEASLLSRLDHLERQAAQGGFAAPPAQANPLPHPFQPTTTTPPAPAAPSTQPAPPKAPPPQGDQRTPSPPHQGPPPPGTSSQGGSSQGGPAQGGSSQGGSSQGGPAQGGPAQGGPAQGGPAQGGPAQGGPAQGGPAQGGLTEGGPLQGGSAQGGLTEGGPLQGGSAQGGLTEGGPLQGGSAQSGSAEGGPPQGGLAEGGPTQGGAAQGGPLQDGSGQGGAGGAYGGGGQGPSGSSSSVGGRAASVPSEQASVDNRGAGSSGSSPSVGGMPAESPGAGPAAGGGADISAVQRLWPDVVEAVKQRSRAAWMVIVSGVQPVALDGKVLTLGFDAEGHRLGFVNGGRDTVLREVLKDRMGVEWRIETVVGGAGGGRAPSGPGPGGGGQGGGRPGAGSAPGAGFGSSPPSGGFGSSQPGAGFGGGSASGAQVSQAGQAGTSSLAPGPRSGSDERPPASQGAGPPPEEMPPPPDPSPVDESDEVDPEGDADADGAEAETSGMALLERELGGQIIREIDNSAS